MGEYNVFLRISKYGDYTSDNNYQCIQLANDGIWNEEIGANQIGSVCVMEDEETETEEGETTKLTEPEEGELTQPEETTQDTNNVIWVEKIKLTGISKKIAAGKGKTVKIKVMTTDGSNLKKTLKIKIK